MRRQIILSLCLLLFISLTVSGAHAQISELKFENVNIDYSNDLGNIWFDRLFIDQKDAAIDLRGPINLERRDDSIQITSGDIKFIHKDISETFISEIKNVEVDNGKLLYRAGKNIDIFFNQLALQTKKSEQTLKHLELSCFSNEQNDHYLTPCLKDGFLALKEIELDEQSKSVLLDSLQTNEVLNYINENSYIHEKELIDPNRIEDIRVAISSNFLNFRARLRFLFRWKLKIEGPIDLVDDKTLRFHLKKARVGWFSVRGKIIEALKKSDIEGLTIKGRTIYLEL